MIFMMQKNELRVLGNAEMTVIVAQARKSESEKSLYTFVHCDVTGTGTGTYLGRAWMAYSKVIFAYSTLSSVLNPLGWSNNRHPEYDK